VVTIQKTLGVGERKALLSVCHASEQQVKKGLYLTRLFITMKE